MQEINRRSKQERLAPMKSKAKLNVRIKPFDVPEQHFIDHRTRGAIISEFMIIKLKYQSQHTDTEDEIG